MISNSFPARALAGLALLLSAIAFLAAPAARAAVSDDEIARYADQLFSQAFPADEPGAAVLVAKDGKVLLRKGYGMADLELGVPVQPDMVFKIASVTKQFTAAAILMLQERGKLSVEDEITKYLPDFPTHGQKITIHHLLTHTSGLPSYTSMPEWQPRWREDMTVQQAIDMFRGKPLDFNPGERQSYSNSGYTLLGAIIEKASGMSYEDFVEQEIFASLGMKRSRYGHDTELVPGRVTGYDRAEDGYRLAPFLSMTQPYSAGSLMSTVDDLALWAEALSSGKLIKRESLERMTTPAKLTTGKPNNYAYGLAIWEEEGTRIVEHSGGIPGFFSDLLSIPDRRLVVVVLSNKPPEELAPAVLAFRVAMKALGKPVEERKAMDLDPATLDEYVGVYRFDETLARTIFREGNKLVAQRTGGEKLEVLATSRDELFYPGLDSRIRFRRDAQGKITGMDFFQLFGPAFPGVKTDEPLPAERQAVQVDPSLYDNYAGVYELAPGFVLTVTREGDRLMTQATGQPEFEIFPESETRFFLKVFDAQLEFQRGPDGKATGVTLYQGGQVMPAKRVE